MKKIILFTLAAMIFSGCVIVNISDFNTVTAKGERETNVFKVGEYNAIRIEGNCEVNYYSGSNSAGATRDTVILAVQPNVLEYYIVEVKDRELIVRTTKKLNFSSGKEPVLTVSTPVLNRLDIEGIGNVRTYDKINTDSLILSLRGAGDLKAELDVGSLSADIAGTGSIELSGKADIAALNLSGAGELDALELQTRETIINLSGVGTVRAGSSENLTINANGTGSVEYKGSPNLNLNASGPVSVKQIK